MIASPRHMPFILGALALAMAPHLVRIPAWIGLGCLVCWGYLLGILSLSWPRPGRVLRLVLTLSAVAAVLLTTGPGFDRQTGLALFAVTAGLKPLEIRSFRDEAVALFMAYFLVLTGLFFSTSLWMALHMFTAVFAITAVLVHVNHPGGPMTAHLRLAGLMILQALPIMAALFFLFPRIQGSLWGRPADAAGVTGFSDRMSPGDVSRLVTSREVAFRVEFENAIPPRDRLYWRGIVFEDFDGKTWHQGEQRAQGGQLDALAETTYTVTLEPHRQRWLFALDLPFISAPSQIRRGDFTLVARRPVRQRIRYRLTSATDHRTRAHPARIEAALDIPRWTNPRAADLARQWVESGQSPEAVVATALAFFRDAPFVYSLQAPVLDDTPVDTFLFQTRRGYCEHYASAFVFLMRSAGIAARVVGGYLGGELNPYGNYLILRQSDAHAWAEVMLGDRGWVRVDPTAVVAPARIAQDATRALPPDEVAARMGLADYGPLAGWVRGAGMGWDALNNRYHKWVTGYGFGRQKRLLARFGIQTANRHGRLLAALMAAGIVCVLGFVVSRRLPKLRGPTPDPALRHYRIFCRKLARAGLARNPSSGPVDFARQVVQARADLASPAQAIVGLYVAIRYGKRHEKTDVRRLARMVRQFRP
jgi:protein-glutamine gamma-glutamyltransferase